MPEPHTTTEDSFQDAEDQAYEVEESIAQHQSEGPKVEEPTVADEDTTNSSPSKKKKKNKKNKKTDIANNQSDELSSQADVSEELTIAPTEHAVPEVADSGPQEEELITADPTLTDGLKDRSQKELEKEKDSSEENHKKEENAQILADNLKEEQLEPPAQEQQTDAENQEDTTINQDSVTSELDQPIGESTQAIDVASEVSKESKILESQIDQLNHQLNDAPTDDETNPFISEGLVYSKPAVASSPSYTNNPLSPPKLPSRDHQATAPEPLTTENIRNHVPPALPSRDIPVGPISVASPVSPTLPRRDLPARTQLTDPTSTSDSSSPAPPPLPTRKASGNDKIDASQFQPPPLPPQLTAAQKQQHRPSVFQGWFQRSSPSSASKESLSDRSAEYEENYDLLLNRFSENNEELQNKDDVSKELLNTSRMELRSSFAEKVSAIEKNESNKSTSFDSETKDNTELHEIDWPFWTRVVNDYTSVVKSEPVKLSNELSGGIPSQVRGIVWQLVSNSNTQEFAKIYEDLLTKESKFEKNIVKDLSRTSFIADYDLDKEAIHRIIKAYSVLDNEVGYTQGMAFITVPVLLNLTELESFGLLHKLMYGYNIRSLYLPDMPGLMLKLYQFDRLVEDNLPNLHTHFKRQGVQSSMFASQWFLTFFAYKFPLEFVLRIFDIVIAEGFESLLKFAIALVKANESKLLTLKFDDLICFLKDQLFNSYLITPIAEDEDDDETANSTGLGNIFKKKVTAPITVDSYDVDRLVEDAMNVKLPPITLKRYEEEFTEIHRVEKERSEEIEETKARNNQLKKEVRKLEASYTILNREHVQIANEMINGRVKIATLEDENSELKEHNENLRERVKQLQNPSRDEVPVPIDLAEDLKKTMERNLEVMSKNQELEDQVLTLMQEVDKLRAENEALKAPKEEVAATNERKHSKGWAPKIFGK